MTFTLNERYKKEDGYYLLEVNENIKQNESVGDQIGLCKDENICWVSEDIELIDDNIIEFIDNYFTSSIKAFLLIKKILKYK